MVLHKEAQCLASHTLPSKFLARQTHRDDSGLSGIDSTKNRTPRRAPPGLGCLPSGPLLGGRFLVCAAGQPQGRVPYQQVSWGVQAEWGIEDFCCSVY